MGFDQFHVLAEDLILLLVIGLAVFDTKLILECHKFLQVVLIGLMVGVDKITDGCDSKDC